MKSTHVVSFRSKRIEWCFNFYKAKWIKIFALVIQKSPVNAIFFRLELHYSYLLVRQDLPKLPYCCQMIFLKIGQILMKNTPMCSLQNSLCRLHISISRAAAGLYPWNLRMEMELLVPQLQYQWLYHQGYQ